MGAGCSMCNSSEEHKRTKLISNQMKKASQNTRKVHKLLLLGAGGSGKSTFFKQLKCIHGTGIPRDEKITKFIEIIHNNIIGGMQILIERYEYYNKKRSRSRRKSAIVPSVGVVDKDNEKYVEFIKNFDVKEFGDNFEKIKQAITALWLDECIQNIWNIRSRFQIPDSARHFFDKMDAICDKHYLPTDEDCLLSRYQTTGIVQQEFDIHQNKKQIHNFQVYDVGGQRNQRTKWIHCFENVTAIIFIASIAAYDMVLSEDEETNRMEEALDLFSQIVNGRWFKETAMILFLNKIDLFRQKILTTPITVCKQFKDCPLEDEHNEKKSKRFIAQKFVEKRKDEEKRLYIHFTCAIDKKMTKKIFMDVQHVIISNNLEKAALV